MSLFSLIKVNKKSFDPIAEARRVFLAFAFDKLASEAYVFGSAVNDEFHQGSDIDVLW
jgi:predicted nucleotidyltransferase